MNCAFALFIPVTWITAEAVVGTVAGAALGYGVYHVAQGIAGVNADEAAVYQEAETQKEEKKGKKRGKDNEIRGGPPRDPKTKDYLADPVAENAPHTTLGIRKGEKGPYIQGATFDKHGKFQGRTDITNHGRGDHPRPHYHPATSPNSANSPPERIPEY